MNKLSATIALILISLLMLCACGAESAEPPVTDPITDTEPEGPIDRKQAIALASEYWGIRSGEVDELTGFEMSIFVDEVPTAESNSFRLCLRWLVDGHYSNLDEIYIDADSGEITPVNADI